MMVQDYINAFALYLETGDADPLSEFCEDPSQPALLAVYRNGFHKTCIDALKANFPVCLKFLGEDYFKQAAQAYVARFPPKQGTLVGYGEHFAAVVRKLPEQDPEKWRAMPSATADFVNLDYTWLNSLMSANSERILDSDSVMALTDQGRDIAQEELRLNPSVQFCVTEYQVFDLWVTLKTGSEINRQVTVAAAPQTLMFWRWQGDVQARGLSAPEETLMRQLQPPGGRLNDAIEAALQRDPNFDVGETFAACLQNGLLELTTIQ